MTIVTTSDGIAEILGPIVESAVTAALAARATPPPTTPDLDTRKAALAQLGITAPTLRGLCRRGLLTPVHIGKKVMFRRADIVAFVERGGAA